ncbi:MAG: NAD(+) diphosphatase [Rhodospirillaceae bacterium]|nr:NAD(+) diphosphatase [Rhodospirillaceae bacterium]MBT6116664.1 NAD(+) diphosphatase [Rhodospirillaceae bacterium]
MRSPNFFAGGAVDRRADLRRDSDWLSEQLGQAGTRILPVWRSRSLMIMSDQPAAVMLASHEVETLLDPTRVAFLGLVEERAHFSLDLSHLEEEEVLAAFSSHGEFIDLRNTGGLLDPTEGNLLAYARGLAYWHERHRFCAVCGHPAESKDAGHIRRCTNPDCKAPHFPRTDPAVIMLVSDAADERCLLGQAPRFIPGMYSTLAGFVEPGESLEEAVAREVLEESGVPVTNVRYHSSQPWPFPASIMLGFYATATATEITLDKDELADAVWKTREELRNSPEDDSFRLPRGISIARRLIDDWIATG